jgi:hypothetical protein
VLSRTVIKKNYFEVETYGCIVIRFGHSDVNGLDGAFGVTHTLPVLSGPIWRRLIEGTAPGPLGMSGQWSLKAGGRNT